MATFGTATDGGSSSPANTNRALLGKYNCPVAAIISAINVLYATDTGTEHSKALIYADSGGAPGALLGVSASVLVTAGDLAHSMSVAVAAGDYWIGSVVDSFQYGWRLAFSAGSFASSDSINFASPPSTFGVPSASGSELISTYATYTAATLPLILSQPASTTAIEDGYASFTVLAAASSGSLSYQWQDNRTGTMANVPDGTGGASAIYAIASARLQQSGRQVQCVVTDSNGSTTSNAVTLQVGRYPDLLVPPPRKRKQWGGASMGVDIREWW